MKTNSTYREKAFLSEVTDVDIKNGIVTGYFASFNNVDLDGDMIAKGAFSKTISERGPDGTNQIWHLLDHDTSKKIGKPYVLREDEKGLYYETRVVTTQAGIDALKLYQAGVLNEHSIGFNIINGTPVEMEGKAEYFKITEVKLWEGSGVTWGANPETPFMGMKGFNSMGAGDKLKALNSKVNNILKGLKCDGLSDETFSLLELNLNQLQKMQEDIINSLSITKAVPEQSTPDNNDSRVLNTFINKLNF